MTEAARAGVTVLLVRYDHVSSRRPPGTIITVPSAAGLGPGQEELGWRVAQFESAVLVLGRTWEATRISLSLSLLVLGRTWEATRISLSLSLYWSSAALQIAGMPAAAASILGLPVRIERASIILARSAGFKFALELVSAGPKFGLGILGRNSPERWAGASRTAGSVVSRYHNGRSPITAARP